LIKDDDERKKVVVNNLSKSVGDKVTKEELKHVSYWMPGFGPGHHVEKLPPPPKRPPSPNTSQPLRLKDLFPINLQVDVDTLNLQDKKYVCAVSGKQITFQNVILLKKANAVILESVFNDLVKPTMVCPITGGKLK
jgi:nitric oxide synthase-interacting protein